MGCLNRKAECCPEKPYYAKNMCRSHYDLQQARKRGEGILIPKDCPVCLESFMSRWGMKYCGIICKGISGRWSYLFKITPEEYHKRLENQGGGCATCGTTSPGGTRRFFDVDHCHETGVVRGLLCRTCNQSLGLAKNNPKILRNQADYLENIK